MNMKIGTFQKHISKRFHFSINKIMYLHVIFLNLCNIFSFIICSTFNTNIYFKIYCLLIKFNKTKRFSIYFQRYSNKQNNKKNLIKNNLEKNNKIYIPMYTYFYNFFSLLKI